ncbi:MAG: 5'-3' exonuclease H3TH domain-containing protein [Patescibacteria group bacterium]
MQKLLLIDGNSLFHRAYHALPPLTDKKGEMANAVFGFSNMIIKAIGEVKPTHIACAFDTAAPTFRHVEFEKYKAQRPAPPPDLYPQLPKVKKVLDAFGIAYFEMDGYEADDVLATLATQVLRLKTKDKRLKQKKEFDVVILSGDRDCLQLVDGNIKVQAPGWNLKETTLYGAKEVREKYGLETRQMVDYKSLIGDVSDNVPGIAGIGPKTAAQLLQKYHTLENLFKHIDEQPESIRAKLEAGKDIALAAKKLVELDRNVDLKFKIENLKFKPNWDQVRAEYEDLGFKSIVSKLPGSKGSEGTNETDETVSQSQSVKSKTKRNDDQLKLI